MSDQEMKELRRVLAQAVEVLRLPRREIERELGLGSGSLTRWLEGDIEIRLRHLLALARLLNVAPVDFLELGFPELNQNARYRLSDRLQPPQVPLRGQSAQEASGAPGDLKELVRQVLREEEERRGTATKEEEGKKRPRQT
jgi:transcriptional regulator with XRE-family HTH domain